MEQQRNIEIDLDVHKHIEMQRKSFAETPNDVLRRLFGLKAQKKSGRQVASAVSGARDWTGKGVTLVHGTELRMEYNGKRHSGRIDKGEWLVEGKRFRSASAAAGGVALTKAGTHPSLDGWIYWEAKRPGDDHWTPINTLRKKSKQH